MNRFKRFLLSIQQQVRKAAGYLKGSQQRIAAVLFLVLFVGFAAHQLVVSHAATPSANFEAENGALSSGACAITDSTASNGSAVSFGNASCPAGGGSAPTSGTPICGQSILNSPYNYSGAATSSSTSGQYAGLPTFGSAGTNFPSATSIVIIPTGDNSTFFANHNAVANTIYYFEPGTHNTAGNGAFPANNDIYIGGYTPFDALHASTTGPALVDGGGANASGQMLQGPGSNVSVEYLTITNWVSSQNSSFLNSGGNDGWTFSYNTIGPNELAYGGATGQNSGGGYAIDGGSNTTITYNCLTQNAQGAFNLYGGADGTSGTGLPSKILTGLVVSNNEISYNGLGTYPDYGSNPKSCGCSGGGKIFYSLNTVVTNNYVHDNYNNGIWFDFNNAGANISGNYVANNWDWGIYYEASYNANISNNTLVGNGWASHGNWPSSSYCSAIDATYSCANGAGPSGQDYGNESAGGILIPDSGGNSNIPGSNYSGHLYIKGNTLTDNWSGIDLYQDDTRFSGVFPNQCNSPLLGLNPTYTQQWNQEQAEDVSLSGTSMTSSAGFGTFYQNGTSGQTSYCAQPGPTKTPSAGLKVYDSAGKIPSGDTVASCSSANSCTLTTAATGSTSGDTVYLSATGGCGYADLIGSSVGATSGSPAADYWDNCLWATRNITVSNNNFNMASNSVTDCTAANFCGVMAIIDAGQGFPAQQFDIYNGNTGYFTHNAPISTSPLNNVFGSNAYTWTGSAGPGAWQFEAGSQGASGSVTHAQWLNTYHQDANSSGL